MNANSWLNSWNRSRECQKGNWRNSPFGSCCCRVFHRRLTWRNFEALAVLPVTTSWMIFPNSKAAKEKLGLMLVPKSESLLRRSCFGYVLWELKDLPSIFDTSEGRRAISCVVTPKQHVLASSFWTPPLNQVSYGLGESKKRRAKRDAYYLVQTSRGPPILAPTGGSTREGTTGFKITGFFSENNPCRKRSKAGSIDFFVQLLLLSFSRKLCLSS